jgi:hypothetical protein
VVGDNWCVSWVHVRAATGDFIVAIKANSGRRVDAVILRAGNTIRIRERTGEMPVDVDELDALVISFKLF